MDFNLDFEQKVERVRQIIGEAFNIQKENPIFIPQKFLSPETVGFQNIRDVLRILEDKKEIKINDLCWGSEIKEKGKRRFEKIGDEDPMSEDPEEYFRAYIIEILNESQYKKLAQIYHDLILDKNGFLYNTSTNERMHFRKKTARYILLKALINGKGEFVDTNILRIKSDKKNNPSVRKEMNAIKKRLAKLLRITKPAEGEVIEGLGDSGYRIKIKIKVVRVYP